MWSIRKLRRLNGWERRLLLATLGRLLWVRLWLWLAPAATVRRWTQRTEGSISGGPPADQPTLEQVAWSVRVASRAIPGATCLCQALTVHAILDHLGYPATVRIGVIKAPGGRLVAHAWLESNGRIVIGQRSDLAAYTVLPAWGEQV